MQSQGSMQPNSNSYSPAQEDDGENNYIDGQFVGDYPNDPYQVPFDDQGDGFGNPAQIKKIYLDQFLRILTMFKPNNKSFGTLGIYPRTRSQTRGRNHGRSCGRI